MKFGKNMKTPLERINLNPLKKKKVENTPFEPT